MDDNTVPKPVKSSEIESKHTDSDGFKYINQFKILRKYGEGSHAKVKECLDTNSESQEKYAIKIFNKLILRKQKQYFKKKTGGMRIKTGLDKIELEISLLSLLSHPNIVKLHEIINDEENDKLYIRKPISCLKN